MDVNVSLGKWPFQDLRPDTAESLAMHLQAEQISSAWVSSVDSILFEDPDVHDARLFKELKQYPSLIPVKTINPMLANWEDSLKRAVEELGARSVKIYMNYHRLSARDYRVCRFMEVFSAYRLPLMIQMRVDDERNQHPLMRVPAVGAQQIVQLAGYFPETNLIVLGPLSSDLAAIGSFDNVYVDISFADGVDVVSGMLDKIPVERVLFGSHTPFFYTRSAKMKLERAGIDEDQKLAIGHGNARRLFV